MNTVHSRKLIFVNVDVNPTACNRHTLTILTNDFDNLEGLSYPLIIICFSLYSFLKNLNGRISVTGGIKFSSMPTSTTVILIYPKFGTIQPFKTREDAIYIGWARLATAFLKIWLIGP